jgi:hypothetical protein
MVLVSLLNLVAAVALVDDLPDNVVALHEVYISVLKVNSCWNNSDDFDQN